MAEDGLQVPWHKHCRCLPPPVCQQHPLGLPVCPACITSHACKDLCALESLISKFPLVFNNENKLCFLQGCSCFCRPSRTFIPIISGRDLGQECGEVWWNKHGPHNVEPAWSPPDISSSPVRSPPPSPTAALAVKRSCSCSFGGGLASCLV